MAAPAAKPANMCAGRVRALAIAEAEQTKPFPPPLSIDKRVVVWEMWNMKYGMVRLSDSRRMCSVHIFITSIVGQCRTQCWIILLGYGGGFLFEVD